MVQSIYRCEDCGDQVKADRHGGLDYAFCEKCSAYVGYWADEMPVKLVHHTATYMQIRKLAEQG